MVLCNWSAEMGENGKHCYPAAAMEVTSAELGHTAASKCYDDDGRLKRTGEELGSSLALRSGLARFTSAPRAFS